MKDNLQMLQFKLQSILKNNSIKRVKLATTGKIVPSRMAHYKTSNLLFSQPIPNTWKKYKCDFLLDVSGSMNWTKIVNAVKVLQEMIRLFYWIIDFRITCFGLWDYPMTAREILSIDTNKLGNNFHYIFDRKLEINTDADWYDNFTVRYEKWTRSTSDNTCLTQVLAKTWLNIKDETGEKFIVLITDWEEWIRVTNPEKTKICWLDIKKYNWENHKQIKKEIENNWINILPIWIWQWDLAQHYDNFVLVDNPEEIYWPVLQFIEKNFI